MRDLPSASIEASYARCGRVARRRASNFYRTFQFLPAAKRKAIYAAYAFCRLCDEVADGDLPRSEKDARLRWLEQGLERAAEGWAEGPLFPAVGDAIRRFGIPTRHFLEVVEGVRLDLDHRPFERTEELFRYCYLVASSVGQICIRIFRFRDDAAIEPAIDLGYAMQLTNILRDLGEDARSGRVYLPAEELARFGYAAEDLRAGVVNDAYVRLMRFQVDRAREYFSRSKRLFPHLAPDSRYCPRALAGMYGAVLHRIEASGYDVFARRPQPNRMDKARVLVGLWMFRFLGW